ncbi:hypothetical protein Scep_020232 [Stephania cephalantha]|uniref:F-box domain-containing protein n=1 Tax=Stephania cephalantha TaxID=152367 RepID=A0AAP0ICT6_9MAGN
MDLWLSQTTNNTKTINASSSAVGSEVEEDIIFQEILPRLPFPSIISFKLVCKKWHNFITHDPLFGANHSRKCPEITNNITTFISYESKLFITEHYQFYSSNLEFIKDISDEKVLGCVDGLLYGVSSKDSQIFVCNPVTKHTIFVPNPARRTQIGLAWDPHNPDFGFTVVLVWHDYNGLEGMHFELQGGGSCLVHFKVYSSKTGEWQGSKNASEFLIPYLRNSQLRRADLSSGGKVYWSLAKHILWFDVEEDNAGLIQLPKHGVHGVLDSSTYRRSTKIGMFDGELSYSVMTYDEEIEIWLLRDKNKKLEWMKKHKLNLKMIVEENRNVALNIYDFINVQREIVARAFAHHRDLINLLYLGGEILWFQMLTLEGHLKVFLFNLRTRELKLITGVIEPPLFPFVPTLLPCLT